MSIALNELPDDVDALKNLVLEKTARNAQLTTENERYRSQVDILQEQLNIALAKRFASRSEQLSPDQIRLFDEAESTLLAAVEIDIEETVTVSPHGRKKGGRKPLPTHLPRVDVIHELAEAERRCDHNGKILAEIGEVVSEQLDIVPATIQVLRHIRKQYACDCGQCIKTAPLPAQPIPKSMASPGLLAHIAVCKYVDGLPLYRQETILNRINVDIPRGTKASWMSKVGTLVQPLINLMRDRLLDHDIIQMDETRVQVLKEAGRRAQSQSYLWVQRGGPPDGRVILYDYDPSRSGAVPQRLLAGYRGYLQTDGYDGYNAVVATNGLKQLGCMAPARRRFDEAVKAQGKNKRRGKAWRGLSLIQKLYRVEKQARPMSADERHAYRIVHAKPVLDEMRGWLDAVLPQVLPNGAVGKALNYLHNEWDKLTRYLDDGRLEIDNNLCENAVRPFVIGRKAWLFSDSVAGVNASANLYSLLETAKSHGLEPYAYLREIFTKLPGATTVDAIEALLPGNIRI
jgi:transposase